MYSSENIATHSTYESGVENKVRSRLILTFLVIWIYIVLIAGLFAILVNDAPKNLTSLNTFVNILFLVVGMVSTMLLQLLNFWFSKDHQ